MEYRAISSDKVCKLTNTGKFTIRLFDILLLVYIIISGTDNFKCPRSECFFSLCDSLKETPVGKRGTDFRSSFFLITRYRNIYKLHRETEKQGFLYLRIYEAAFPIKGALNRPTPHYYALITHFLAKVTIYFLFFFYIFKVKEKYSYLYKL